MTKRWECTVCGYIHLGNEPPKTCPVCGADRSKFVLVSAERTSLLDELVGVFKLHPVMAHFPGGLIPTAVFFLVLYFMTGQANLEAAAFWLVLIVVAVSPVSIGSGLYDWYKYFSGKRAFIFYKKIGLALALFALGLLALSLRYGHPELLASFGWQSMVFLAIILGMLGCVTLLGHYGSMLASQARPAQAEASESLTVSKAGDDWSKTILEQAPDAILAADTSGAIRLWNLGAERIFSIPAAQALGQSLDLIIPEQLRKRHWQGWAQVMLSGKSHYGEDELLRVPAIRGDGSRFSAEFSIVMVKDETEKILGVAAILRDVSQQWEQEKSLKAQLKLCLENKSS